LIYCRTACCDRSTARRPTLYAAAHRGRRSQHRGCSRSVRQAMSGEISSLTSCVVGPPNQKKPRIAGFQALNSTQVCLGWTSICRPEHPALKGPPRKCGTCASVRAADHSRLATMGCLAAVCVHPDSPSFFQSKSAVARLSDFCRNVSHCDNAQRLYRLQSDKTITDQWIDTHPSPLCDESLIRKCQTCGADQTVPGGNRLRAICQISAF